MAVRHRYGRNSTVDLLLTVRDLQTLDLLMRRLLLLSSKSHLLLHGHLLLLLREQLVLLELLHVALLLLHELLLVGDHEVRIGLDNSRPVEDGRRWKVDRRLEGGGGGFKQGRVGPEFLGVLVGQERHPRANISVLVNPVDDPPSITHFASRSSRTKWSSSLPRPIPTPNAPPRLAS